MPRVYVALQQIPVNHNEPVVTVEQLCISLLLLFSLPFRVGLLFRVVDWDALEVPFSAMCSLHARIHTHQSFRFHFCDTQSTCPKLKPLIPRHFGRRSCIRCPSITITGWVVGGPVEIGETATGRQP